MFKLEDNFYQYYGKFNTLQECFDKIKTLADVNYYRIMPKDDFHRIHIDYGSHTHFFDIISDHNFEEEYREAFRVEADEEEEIDRNEYKKALIYKALVNYYDQLLFTRNDEFYKQLTRNKIRDSEKTLKELL